MHAIWECQREIEVTYIAMAFIPIRGVNDTIERECVCVCALNRARWLAHCDRERLASEKWNKDLFENMCVKLAQHIASQPHISNV